MQIYNTMTRQKEELKPITPGTVKIYACGPTVYNLIHIGNARALCVFDTLRRYLEFRGYKVFYVQNFTDVDDKIIKKANELGKTAHEVSENAIREYFTDADGLNVRRADVHPKVTENMDIIIDIVKTLIEKGFAYEADGDVYFETSKFPEYGKLSHMPLEDLQAGARIEVGEKKRDPMDFAVWKAAKPGEPYWDSPFGKGRPGWHIECSAMSRHYIGDTIDIHGGGADLIFPHHENEIAQSEAYLGHKWCNYWFHILHLNTNSGKMSKSKGEFLTVSLLESKGYDPLVYRFFCLQSHYRKSLVFTYENLDNAKTAYNKLTARIAQLMADKKPDEVVELEDFEKFKGSFKAALDDDINTSNAITVLYDVLKADTNNETKLALIEDFDKVLSLGLIEAAKKLSADGEEDIPEEVKVLVEERKAARKAKDFAKADELRDKIGELGYIVEETRQGTKIKKK